MTTVEKIHAEVGQASAVLLQDAPYDAFQVESLNRLGFTQAETVRDFNDHKAHHGHAVYYSQKYPQYKFITEHQLAKVETKYKLRTAGLGEYKGNVPERNLHHILQFTADSVDIAYDGHRGVEYGGSFFSVPNDHYWPERRPSRRRDSRGPNGYRIYETYMDEARYLNNDDYDATRSSVATQTNQKLSFAEIVNRMPSACQITADEALFTIPDPELDPIVTLAVLGGYLVVTAWGAEASDPDVVNHRNN
jgi:hypothetical protein